MICCTPCLLLKRGGVKKLLLISCKIIIILLYLLLPQVSPMFEFICEEDELFRPYVRIYAGRRGELLHVWGPGFHPISADMNNLWVCINGPAYLFYSKNNSYGVVYESPQPHVYVHTCETHNIIPRPGATHKKLVLHLMGVLLYGDGTDYRRPSIQTFSAPYFFGQDEYFPGFEPHFQNATSVAIIGKLGCVLQKGMDNDPNKIGLTFNAVHPPAPPPPPTPPTTPSPTPSPEPPPAEPQGYICRQAFSELLSAAKGTPPDSPENKKMRNLVLDDKIGEGTCGPELLDADTLSENITVTELAFQNADSIFQKATTAAWNTDYATKVKTTTDALGVELKDVEDKIAATSPAPTPKELKKLLEEKANLEEAIQLEKDKEVIFTKLWTEVDTAMKAVPPLVPPSGFGDAAIQDVSLFRDAETELEKLMQWNSIPVESVMKTAMEDKITTKDTATASTVTAWKIVSTWQHSVYVASFFVSELDHSYSHYTPTNPHNLKKKKKKKSKKVTYPEKMSSPASYDVPETSCQELPTLSRACVDGKPNVAHSSTLFKTSLGIEPIVWQTDADTKWKEDVLTEIGTLFSEACPYLPDRRRFVRQMHRILSYYLTNADFFNLHQPAPGTASLTCIQFAEIVPPTTPPEKPSPEPNTARRPFWDQIMEILKECHSPGHTLVFRDLTSEMKKKKVGQWVWVKQEKNGSLTELWIKPQKEQAENEFVFNWVIDMSWRIFATVLGICVVDHEDRIPHVASKFHSLFTEDFLIPLRETWINPKDNVIFQWILGEFYNGEAEKWAELCMEASFLRSERLEEYRPPRSLLVNCATEHNYFIEGKFAGKTGIYAN